MGRTLTQQKSDNKVAYTIDQLRQMMNEIRANQNRTLSFINIILDSTGSTGTMTFGSGTSAVILQLRTGTGAGVDFFNGLGTKIASLDSSGNFKCSGTITQNTTP